MSTENVCASCDKILGDNVGKADIRRTDILSSDIFEDILNRGVDPRVRVSGRSMAPFLKGGEIVTIKKIPASALRRGDLVLFKDEVGNLLLHRLIYRKQLPGNQFVLHTKGDASKSFDPPVRCAGVLGRVSAIEKTHPKRGRSIIDLESHLWKYVNYFNALLDLVRHKVKRVLEKANYTPTNRTDSDGLKI